MGFGWVFQRHGTIENNHMIGNHQAGIAVENGIHFQVRDNLFMNNRHGILLWSKHVPYLEHFLPDNITSQNWQIENNTFLGNYKALRIAADQDHGIRPLPISGELGLPAPKPSNHVIRNNKFQENTYVIDQIDTLNSTIDQNEYLNNIYD